MTELFLKIVNMSISTTWLVLAVLMLRLILKRIPKWVHVLLWGIVAVRLLCPFSIESALSLIPSAETISPDIMMDPTPQITTGIPAINAAVNPVISESFAPQPLASANPLQIWIPVVSAIWLLGVAVMVLYTAVSYFRLGRSVGTATRLYGNIYQSAHIPTPFVLGILKPRIYLPYGMKERDMAHVIAHEQTHIRRKDHWWKPLGFLLLTVHWFNPFVWVAYILLCRDIELACDEKVIKELGRDQRADYSQALLTCSVDRRMIAACPLAFGEVGVKQRVRNVLNYKKPAFWVIAVSVILCVIVAVCFLTDPNPSREFSMRGENVSGLDPEAIVERIVDIEDITNSGVHVNSDNFSITVDSNFNWMDSQAVRYFYSNAQKTYCGQLRIFPDEGKYFLTEPDEWIEQDRNFLLRHYLEALKYLPQYEIQQMAPADRYLIRHIEEGTPSDYERVITYSSQRVEQTDGWFIHLQLEPLHAEGEGYRGTGDEVVHLFYGDDNVEVSYGINKWFDFGVPLFDFGVPEVFEYPQYLEKQHPAFHGVTFRCDGYSITAEDETGETTILQGMPIWNVYFTDLTGDVIPEICATVSFGSGMVDTHVVVYDYANGQEYTLWDRGTYDYYLRMENEKLLCDQFTYAGGGPVDRGDLLASGELILADAGGGGGKCLIIDQIVEKPGEAEFIVSIIDRTVTERLPTDEAIEPFYEDDQYVYSFASIRSHLVIVSYNDGSSEDIKTALAAGRATIDDLKNFGIHFYVDAKHPGMQPTQTNLRGLVAGYLFTPFNGGTYRYALTDANPANVTADYLLDTFTESYQVDGVVWEVYTLKEYPDKSKLLLRSGVGSAWLCEYAPAMQAEEGALEAARAEGYVICEDGRMTGGKEAWEEFYEKTRRGEHASIQVAHYYTLDPDRTASDTYEAYRQDYPALYIHELSYDGERFVLRTESDVRVYEYLMKYETSGTPPVGSTAHQNVTRYVLTHDRTHTWDQLWSSLLSSAAGVAIDHYTICSQYS